MAGRPSAAMIKAMRLIRQGMTPYQAAEKVGLDKPNLYRSRLYREWKAEQAFLSGPSIETHSLQEDKS